MAGMAPWIRVLLPIVLWLRLCNPLRIWNTRRNKLLVFDLSQINIARIWGSFGLTCSSKIPFLSQMRIQPNRQPGTMNLWQMVSWLRLNERVRDNLDLWRWVHQRNSHIIITSLSNHRSSKSAQFWSAMTRDKMSPLEIPGQHYEKNETNSLCVARNTSFGCTILTNLS